MNTPLKVAGEFREFISKGNVMDLAVGVIIGGAFGKIVTSLVEDVIMPPIGILIGGVNFTDFKLILKQASVDAAGKTIPAVSVNYGNFIQIIFNFLIIAFSIFLMVKLTKKLRKKQEDTEVKAQKAQAKKESKELAVLTEIRDLLKQQSQK